MAGWIVWDLQTAGKLDGETWDRAGRCVYIRSQMDFLFFRKDGEIHHFDLCEDCYNEVTAEFRVPVDVEDEIELL